MQIKDVLRVLREAKSLSQEELCQGLCPRSTYARYEKGKQQPNRLLLNILMQRMGKNPDKLMGVLSEEEYQYFVWKRKILMAVNEGNMYELQRYIKEADTFKNVPDKNLHTQFICQMQVIASG